MAWAAQKPKKTEGRISADPANGLLVASRVVGHLEEYHPVRSLQIDADAQALRSSQQHGHIGIAVKLFNLFAYPLVIVGTGYGQRRQLRVLFRALAGRRLNEEVRIGQHCLKVRCIAQSALEVDGADQQQQQDVHIWRETTHPLIPCTGKIRPFSPLCPQSV